MVGLGGDSINLRSQVQLPSLVFKKVVCVRSLSFGVGVPPHM
jgi:hypothetical protein